MAKGPLQYVGLTLAVRRARSGEDRAQLAEALRSLAGFERRTPLTRRAALRHYEEAIAIFRKLDMPLTLAHTLRHLGIVHEYGERLDEAERNYDEALALYREHETADTLDYANAVRYPAVIKNRLGKRDESTRLWEEAHDRYVGVGIVEGVAEAAAHLTVFALEKGDEALARDWFARASAASAASSDAATHKFIAEVGATLEAGYP